MIRNLFIFLVLFLAACTGNKQENSQMQERIDSLQKENDRKDKDINDMTTFDRKIYYSIQIKVVKVR